MGFSFFQVPPVTWWLGSYCILSYARPQHNYELFLPIMLLLLSVILGTDFPPSAPNQVLLTIRQWPHNTSTMVSSSGRGDRCWKRRLRLLLQPHPTVVLREDTFFYWLSASHQSPELWNSHFKLCCPVSSYWEGGEFALFSLLSLKVMIIFLFLRFLIQRDTLIFTKIILFHASFCSL